METLNNKSNSYLALICQKISRENKEKFPTPESVSKYRIAKELETTETRIRNYYIGRSQFDEDMCIRVGRYLGITEILVIIDVMGDRTKSPEAKKLYKEAAKIIKVDFAKRAKALSVGTMIVLVGLVGLPEEAVAAPFSILLGTLQCILCKIVLAQLERLRRFKRRFKSRSKHSPQLFAHL